MELAGLIVGGVGLVGIYGACTEIIEHIDSYKNIAVEARPLLAEFEVNRTIFRKWAERVGLSNKGLASTHDSRLDDPDISNAVFQVLSCIRSILSGTSPVRNVLEGKGSQPRLLRQNTGRFDSPSEPTATTHDSLRKRDRLGWSFGGKQKFASQVELFGAFVGKLNMLIPDLGGIGSKMVRRGTGVAG
jgi:Prion-inhibition and propagation